MLSHQDRNRDPPERFGDLEHTNNVGAAFYLPFELPKRVGGSDSAPTGSGETLERKQVLCKPERSSAVFPVNIFQSLSNFNVLIVATFGIWLIEDRPNQESTYFLPALRQRGDGISQETNPRTLES